MPVQVWISILELASFSSLIALGFFIVLRGADLFMFALGPLAMFAAMFGSYQTIKQGWPLPIAILVGVLISVVLSSLTEVSVVRPIHLRTGGEENPSIIAVVAILFALEQLAGWLFGRAPLPGQQLWSARFDIGDAVITGQTAILLVVTLICFIGIWWWMKATPSGRMLRAVGDNEQAARMIGVPVNRIRLMAFALAGLLAGIAGTIFAAKAGVSFVSGLQWSLAGFLAVIVGGLGSVWAPLAGALIVAGLQTASIYYFGQSVQVYLTFILAFAFFAFRPQGIFQNKVRI